MCKEESQGERIIRMDLPLGRTHTHIEVGGKSTEVSRGAKIFWFWETMAGSYYTNHSIPPQYII